MPRPFPATRWPVSSCRNSCPDEARPRAGCRIKFAWAKIVTKFRSGKEERGSMQPTDSKHKGELATAQGRPGPPEALPDKQNRKRLDSQRSYRYCLSAG